MKLAAFPLTQPAEQVFDYLASRCIRGREPLPSRFGDSYVKRAPVMRVSRSLRQLIVFEPVDDADKRRLVHAHEIGELTLR